MSNFEKSIGARENVSGMGFSLETVSRTVQGEYLFQKIN